MSLQTLAQAAFSSIKTAVPSAVAVVVYGSQTANGIKDMKREVSELTDRGEVGNLTSRVWVNASDMVQPSRGDSIKVDGVEMFVNSVAVDSSGVLFGIEYSKQRPMTL